MSIINGAGLNAFRSQFTAGTTYALAEVIDNSIQWKQKNKSAEINIVFIESKQSSYFAAANSACLRSSTTSF